MIFVITSKTKLEGISMSDDVKREETDGFLRYYKAFKEEIGKFEQHITNMQVSFDNAQRAHAAGIQNVYNKFIELEKRQKKLEELLQSDRIEKVLAVIPTEEDVLVILKNRGNQSHNELSKEFNVSAVTIRKIWYRQIWKHVNQQSEKLKVIDDPLDPEQYCQISGCKLDKSCRECGLDKPMSWMEILDDYVHGKNEIKVCKTCHNQYVKIIDCEHRSLEETDMRKCFKCGAIYS